MDRRSTERVLGDWRIYWLSGQPLRRTPMGAACSPVDSVLESSIANAAGASPPYFKSGLISSLKPKRVKLRIRIG